MSVEIRKKLLKAILLIIALLVLLSDFGEMAQPPFPLSFNLSANDEIDATDYHYAEFREGVGGVILDEGYTRVIFLDKDKKANAYINLDMFNLNMIEDTVDYFADVALDDEYVYLFHYQRVADNNHIKHQKIVKYDYYGNEIETVWEKEYDLEKTSIINPRIFSFCQDQKNTYAVYLDENDKYADIINVSSGSGDVVSHFDINAEGTIYNAQYNANTNSLGILTEIGDFQLYKDNHLIKSQSNCGYKEHIKINDDGSYNLLAEHPNASDELHKIDFSALLIFKTILFWIAFAFIVIYGIKKLIDLIRKLIKKREIRSILTGAAAVVVVVLILALSGYYSMHLIEDESNVKISLLTANAKNSASLMRDTAGRDINALTDKDEYFRVKNKLFELRQNSLEANQNTEYTLLYHEKDDDSNVVLASTHPWMPPGKRYVPNSEILDLSDTTDDHFSLYSIGVNKGTTLMARQTIIKQDSKPLLSICTSSDVLEFEAQMFTNMAYLFVILLVAIVAIILTCLEIGGVYSSFKLKNKLRLAKAKNPEIGLSRTFGFLVVFVTSFDGALMVLIAKDIVTQNNMSDGTFLIGIPATAIAAGMVLGRQLFNSMSRYINIKFMIIIYSIFLMAAYFACFNFVAGSNFYGYCVGIFFSGVFTGALNGIKYYMPLLSPNDDVRFDMSQKYSMTSISGNVVSVALAGIIVDAIGSQYIYLMAIIPSFMFTLLAIIGFPKNKKYYMKTENFGKEKAKNSLKFFFSPPFVTYVLFMIVASILATGYKTFLFPLFTSDAGIPKAMISNYIVLGNFVAFVVNKLSEKSIKKYDFLTAIVFCTLAIGIVFLTFLVNNSIGWPILVITIIIVLVQIGSTCSDMLWPRLCKNWHFPEQICNKVVQYTGDFTYTVRSMILSALIALGIQGACVCLGLYMIVGAVIFFVVAKKTKAFDEPKEIPGSAPVNEK